MKNRIDLAQFSQYAKAFEDQSLVNNLKPPGLEYLLKGNGALKKEQSITSAFNASRWRDKKQTPKHQD